MPVKHAPTHVRSKSLINSTLIGLILFILLAVLFEGLFRLTRLDERYPLRSLGVYHSQFEIKWFKLKEFVEENGGVDVILLGSSMVNTGIDPEILVQRYAFKTGENLRIFNFGVEGLTIQPNSALARLLVEEYHPGTLLFVTEMRDYVAANGVEVARQFLSDEWLRSQISGDYTVRAWLTEHSSLVQHLLPFRNWSRYDFPDTYLSFTYRYAETSDSGYEADYYDAGQAWVPPDPQNPEDRVLFNMLSDFSIAPQRLADLADMLSLSETGTQVIVTELPLHPNYFAYFEDTSAHEKYLRELVPFITSRGGIFLPPISPELIPESYRSDYFHLNYRGAMIYSALLADQLADFCLDEQVCLQRAVPMESAK
jgi:hypothetical protein